MARVLCTRPNASDEISGVAFEKHEDGMLSVDISDEQAAAFVEIPGYVLFGADDGKAAAAELEAQDFATLVEKAKALGVDVKGNWKEARLKAEIQRAEEAAAAKATEDKSE